MNNNSQSDLFNKHFPVTEGTFIFGQVPMFEIDSKPIAQTGAMTRYIARKAGIYGSTDDDKAM
ncbi:hypothetical protein FSP39_020062 [Pinctada imbricata]|uniref:GST N-terminal domain-containing protein n=1 Tax=Pinctada imbricata TaxID=66713 RepID=A0AA88YFQ0_PINIB|nr:hypothetical protein FSP39_020062 [Pinctada imbricata]